MRRKNDTNTDERGRWSSKKKMDAVLRLLKGEDLDTLSRELRVNAATLSSWREVFLANGLAGLKSRETDARDEKISQLQKALAETAEPGDLEGDQPGVREEARPVGIREVDEVRCGVSASLNCVVPLNRVCTMTGVARSSVYFARRADVCVISSSRRMGRGAKQWLGDDELVVHIRQVLAATPFLGEGYRKVWAKLRFGGIRTSPGRVMRLMREHNLRVPVNFGAPKGPQSHDGTIIPPAPDIRWGTDLTGTWTSQEGKVSVMLAVDHHTAEILGIHAAKRASRWEALEPVRQAVRRCFGGIRKNVANGLELRHDHGSQYMSLHFQQEIEFLGIKSSPAFVRAPEGNAYVS